MNIQKKRLAKGEGREYNHQPYLQAVGEGEQLRVLGTSVPGAQVCLHLDTVGLSHFVTSV